MQNVSNRQDFFSLLTAEEAASLRTGVPTAERIRVFRAGGWSIVTGNDWRLPSRKKYRHLLVVRLRQTSSRTHGKVIATTFAVRPLLLP